MLKNKTEVVFFTQGSSNEVNGFLEKPLEPFCKPLRERCEQEKKAAFKGNLGNLPSSNEEQPTVQEKRKTLLNLPEAVVRCIAAWSRKCVEFGKYELRPLN